MKMLTIDNNNDDNNNNKRNDGCDDGGVREKKRREKEDKFQSHGAQRQERCAGQCDMLLPR